MLPIIFCEGGPFDCGLLYGRAARKPILTNVKGFWETASIIGLSKGGMMERAIEAQGTLVEDEIERIKGMAAGAQVGVQHLLAYNFYHKIIHPDECTVFIAMGSATAKGNTIMLKNSDKVGSESLVGPKYHLNKEINVILSEKLDNGPRIIGVSAAGETGLKLGMNDRGVAAGTNIVRTAELKIKKVDLTQVRALDRAQLIKDGLAMSNAIDAGKTTLQKILENPMATPGNMQFVDSKMAVLLEGSYDRAAAQKMTDGVTARSNYFEMFKELNDPENFSSIARYIRANRLLLDNRGSITVEKMIKFSQDHENGPGINSICRHHPDFREETSLATGVMEIDRNNPSNSTIDISLGKPCRAWNDPASHVTLRLNMKEEKIPIGFRDGTVFKKSYSGEMP